MKVELDQNDFVRTGWGKINTSACLEGTGLESSNPVLITIQNDHLSDLISLLDALDRYHHFQVISQGHDGVNEGEYSRFDFMVLINA